MNKLIFHICIHLYNFSFTSINFLFDSSKWKKFWVQIYYNFPNMSLNFLIFPWYTKLPWLVLFSQDKTNSCPSVGSLIFLVLLIPEHILPPVPKSLFYLTTTAMRSKKYDLQFHSKERLTYGFRTWLKCSNLDCNERRTVNGDHRNYFMAGIR